MTIMPQEFSLALPNRRSTTRLAAQVAPLLKAGDLLILSGGLGSGKTFFVRALCRKLGLSEQIRVTSPTFSLIQELETSPPIAHADLYRLSDRVSVAGLGLDSFREQGFVAVVEWGAPYIETLGGDALVLEFVLPNRSARLSHTGPRSERLLRQVFASLSDNDKGLKWLQTTP